MEVLLNCLLCSFFYDKHRELVVLCSPKLAQAIGLATFNYGQVCVL